MEVVEGLCLAVHPLMGRVYILVYVIPNDLKSRPLLSALLLVLCVTCNECM